MIYALGFTLEKLAAMQEHGVKGTSFPTCSPHFSPSLSLVYIHGTWVCTCSCTAVGDLSRPS